MSDINTHATAVVRKENFNVVLPGRPYLNIDGTSLAIRKRVRDRVEEEVGQHLSVRPRIAVHGQIGPALDVEDEIFLSQARPQAQDDLFSQVAEIEDALVRVVSISRYLLERLDQFGRVIEIGDQLR